MPRTAKPKPNTARMIDLSELRPFPGNARRGDVAAIAESLEANDQYKPVVVNVGGDKTRMTILAGNHTAEAARSLGWEQVRAWFVDVDDEAARRINLADNRIPDRGEYDEPALAALLAEAVGSDGDDAFLGTGYGENEAQQLIASLTEEIPDDEEVPPVPRKPKTKPGDVYELGDHRLACGDSCDAADVARLLGEDRADLILTSPPYNVEVIYAGISEGRTGWEEYGAFLEAALKAWLPLLAERRAVIWNIGTGASVFPYKQAQLLEDQGLTYLRELIWYKQGVSLPTWHFTEKKPQARQFTPNPVHELVFVFANAASLELGPSIAPVDELTASDVFRVHQSQTDLPDDPAGSRSGSSRSSGLETRARKAHPAAFPTRFAEIFVRHFAAPGEIVCDPFAGAGTVAIAAEKLGRRAVLMEIEPGYCDVIVARWEKLTGEKATRRRRAR